MWWYNYLILFFSLSTVVFAVDNICGIQNVTCNPNDKYRSVDGTCNNLDNPNWGTIGSIYARMLPAKYSDGVHAFALTSSQKPLPNALELTENIYTQGYVETCENVMLGAMTMLQLVAHDLSYTNLTNKACCTENLRNLKPVPERCENIRVSKNDPYYSRINATCLPFERTATNFQAGCQLSQKSADPVNGANNWLDLSVIHGHTYAVNAERRAYINGTLKVQVNNNHEYPPNADRSRCPGLLPFENTCYFTGDGRVNQNPQLTISHTLWIREHNRVARGLAELNSHWNDEKLYQEARLITISEYQHIVFYELLPYFLGREGLIKNKIIYEQPTSRYPMFPIYSNQFIEDYNKTQPPHIYNEFSHGAFRQFHSVIAGKLGLFNNKGCPYDALALRDYIDRPVELETADIFDSLIRGLMHQPQMPSDRYYDPEFTRYMFMKTTRFGTSTRAVDVQRARDHGVPSYNDIRELCGLPKAKNFSGFSDVMPQEHIDILESYYEIPDDVELLVGGSLETNVEGTKAGPTSLCIMYKQFHNVRTADRFFFEGKGTGFTSTQLQEIRKSSMAGIFCRNGNNIKDVQRKAFEQPSVSNPPVCCKYIPSPDLTAWKENV